MFIGIYIQIYDRTMIHYIQLFPRYVAHDIIRYHSYVLMITVLHMILFIYSNMLAKLLGHIGPSVIPYIET